MARSLFLLIGLLFGYAVSAEPRLRAADSIYAQSNLAAWCIVPFDAKKRGPEERAAMLEKLGFTQFVYDYRSEHIPQWDDELKALKKHHVALTGWWFPGSLNAEAKQALELFKRHGVKPALWVTGSGGAIAVKDEADQRARVTSEVKRLGPLAQAAAAVGCTVLLYNHGSWFGEPENMVALTQALRAAGHANVGIVYNLHHGHGHLARLDQALKLMLPYLQGVNLNGMDVDGEARGRKILPLGVGTQDLQVLRAIRASGYNGPIGILNHTGEDAEGRLQDNLDGLRWLVPQMDDAPPGPKPQYRTYTAAPLKAASVPTNSGKPKGVPSFSAEYGKALSGGMVVSGGPEFSTLPLTVECRAKLDSKKGFNILVACEEKASSTHWELYSYNGSGKLSLYLPGRGGNYSAEIDICDGKWHDILANIGPDKIRLWVDGVWVLEKEIGKPAPGRLPQRNEIGFGQLVEGGIFCDGVLDDVRISRGANEPTSWIKGPRKRMDITLGLWDFDNLEEAKPKLPPPPVAVFKPSLSPLRPEDNLYASDFVNRDRVFDFYAKQALTFKAQMPPPLLLPGYPGLDGGNQGHWGNQNDATTWRDGRWDKADHGVLFSGVFRGAGVTVPKGICVRRGDEAACFNPLTLTFPVRWKGGFISLAEGRHGFNSSANMVGKLVAKDETKTMPANGRYHGFYRQGDEVVFAYAKHGHEYLATAGEGEQEVAKLAALTKGGTTQWPKVLVTKGKLGSQRPFATDELIAPAQNPYGTIFFLTGIDFFKDGRAAVCTMTGEVWIVSGLNDSLGEITWKRFATGLHQALGVKIIEDRLYVLGRDQITRLHDLNGDGEADFYECVNNAMTTSPGGHDFIVGLDADSQGRFYTASGNQGILRLTGSDKVEVLATGLRNPNGISVSADGKFILSNVQEGNWTPASAVCQVEIGLNQGTHFGAGGPRQDRSNTLPLLQLPRGEDNSCGGQVFLSEAGWPALRGDGNFLHFSFGTGSAWLVTRQLLEGVWQSAAMKVTGNFSTGPQHGRFGPKDGHLYVSGMIGWGSYTPLDGAIHRIRYVGGDLPVVVAHETRENGVLLRFNQPIDAAVAAQATKHFAQCWNYLYGPAYGSPEYSVKYPDAMGHDVLDVRSAQVLAGGLALFVEIPQLTPASQIHLQVGVTAQRSLDIFITAHHLGPPFKDFAGYSAIPKDRSHEHAAPVATGKVNPVKWEIELCRGPVREMKLQAATGLQYAQKELRAKAGEGIALTIENPDVMPHNFVLLQPGSEERVAAASAQMVAAPDAYARHYVPEVPDILCYCRMLDPGQKSIVYFNAPKTPGRYPYLCSFPGHAMIMRGVLIVE